MTRDVPAGSGVLREAAAGLRAQHPDSAFHLAVADLLEVDANNWRLLAVVHPDEDHADSFDVSTAVAAAFLGREVDQ